MTDLLVPGRAVKACAMADSTPKWGGIVVAKIAD